MQLRSAIFLFASTFCFGALAQSSLINVKSYGAICDGGSHPLNTRYLSLPAAQAVYPFVTSLSQEIDYAAIKQASNVAFGADGAEHGTTTSLNQPLFIPAGNCQLGNDTWTIRNASGIAILGAGQTATILQANGTVLAFDGLWYSRISDMQIASQNAGTVALDIDGNVPGHPYATRTTQGNTLTNVFVDGGHSTYAMALCRQGGGGAQCSENVFVNLHLLRASFAAYYQNGYNALDNVWMGGDCQSYTTNCIYLYAGSIGVFKVSFESGAGYGQIVNGGYDINASSGGVGDGIPVYGSRSESLRFYLGSGSQNADIRAFQHNPAGFTAWVANLPVAQNTMVRGTDSVGTQHLFVAAVPGVSGATLPAWPQGWPHDSGIVTDGTVTWTTVAYNVVQIAAGNFDYTTSSYDPTATVNVVGGTSGYGSINALGQSIGWGSATNGSNAASELFLFAQNQLVALFANPQPIPQTLKSGLPLPAGSMGLIAKGPLTLKGASIVMPSLPISDPHVAGQLWNNGGLLSISGG